MGAVTRARRLATAANFGSVRTCCDFGVTSSARSPEAAACTDDSVAPSTTMQAATTTIRGIRELTSGSPELVVRKPGALPAEHQPALPLRAGQNPFSNCPHLSAPT